MLRENTPEYKLEPGEGLGTAKPKDRQEEFLSQIINRLNEVFVTDQLTDKDMVNYSYQAAEIPTVEVSLRPGSSV